MPPRKLVKSLKLCSLDGLEEMVFTFVLRTAKTIAETHTGHQDVEFRNIAITEITDSFREHLFSHVVWSDYEEVNRRILSAIESAAVIKRKEWKFCEETLSYLISNQMVVVSSLADVIASPSLRILNLNDVPSMSRERIFDILHKFRGVRVLNLGSGSGGVSGLFREKIQEGLRKMHHLTSFSLCYDCDDAIIKNIHRTSRKTLRILDVEMSKGVTDQSARLISECVNIEKLHIFHTSLSPSGHAIILKGLQRLRILVRGDFLCEALEHLETSGKLPILALEEFWSSEEYFFHSAHQMALVQQTCHRMRKVMYQFSVEKMPDLLFLADFSALNELNLWGSEFYSNKLNIVLTQIGPQLKILFLIHVDEIDKRALITITKNCVHLSTLGFYNCEFGEHRDETNFYVDNADIVRVTEQENIQLLLEVETLHIVSHVSGEYLIEILSAVLNVKYISTGMNCQITDDVIGKVFNNNKMQHLQTLKISQSQGLTVASLDLIVATCKKLKSIRDLEYWAGLNQEDVLNFRHWIKENNYELDTDEKKAKDTENESYSDSLTPDVLNYLMGN